MQAISAKEILPKCFIKFALPKECLKTYFKYYYYKVYSLILKGIFSNRISIMQIKPFGQFIKFLF
jgi:hypothetical protein